MTRAERRSGPPRAFPSAFAVLVALAGTLMPGAVHGGASHDWVMFRGEEGRGITATVAGKHLIFGTDRNYFYVMEEVF